jgi:hypothetical protein
MPQTTQPVHLFPAERASRPPADVKPAAPDVKPDAPDRYLCPAELGQAPRKNHPAHERAVVALRFAVEALAALAYAADNEVDPGIDRYLEADADGILWVLRWHVSILEGQAIPFCLKSRRLLEAMSAAYAQTPTPTRREERDDRRREDKEFRAEQTAQNSPAGDDMPPW